MKQKCGRSPKKKLRRISRAGERITRAAVREVWRHLEQLYLLQLWVCTWYSSLILYQVQLRPVVDLCCTQVWRHFEAGLRFEWFTAGTGGCQSQLQLDLEPFPSNWSKQAHHHTRGSRSCLDFPKRKEACRLVQGLRFDCKVYCLTLAVQCQKCNEVQKDKRTMVTVTRSMTMMLTMTKVVTLTSISVT